MQQTWHIFKKDILYLRREICLYLALAAIFAWGEARSLDVWWAELLLAVTAVYLIARLIHAEAIPGDRQFWITRPYRWKSLLAAKILFILVVVNLPICAAQLLILVAGGFPLGFTWPGLLWSQVLLVIGLWLPIAALAAVTSGMVPFIFSVLILLAIGFGGLQMMFVLARLRLDQWPIAVGWVRDSVLVITAVTVAFSLLYMQYKTRRTLLSRTLALCIVILGTAAFWYMPLPSALAIQAWFSKQPFDGSSLQLAVDSTSKLISERPRWSKDVQVHIPIVVTGAPGGAELHADAITAIFQGSDGRVSKSGSGPLNRRLSRPEVFDGIVAIDQSFFNAERQQPLTLHASVYFTLFGNERARTIPLENTPVNVMDGLQCYIGDIFNHVWCRSPFRWPAALVYAKFGTELNPLTPMVSYSPFPAGMNFNDAIEAHWTSAPPSSTREVTITLKEPIAHFHREFEVRGVRLAVTEPRA